MSVLVTNRRHTPKVVFPFYQVFAEEGLKLASSVQAFSKQVIHISPCLVLVMIS